MGQTVVPKERAFLNVLTRNSEKCHASDGCIIHHGKVAGTYLHGFFDQVGIIEKWLGCIGMDTGFLAGSNPAEKEKDYQMLKEHFEAHIDLSPLLA